MSEPIEDYLDDLLTRLRLPARETRRVLAEAEAHLYESAEALSHGGISRDEAEREAVRRFGAPDQLATAARPTNLAVVVGWSATMLAGLGLVAIGASGGLVALANALLGPRFVGGLPLVHSAGQCDYWLSLHPNASSCSVAATLEASHDAVVLRVLAGVVGAALVVVALWWRRWLAYGPQHGVVSALASVAFTVATAALLAQSGQLALSYGSGGVGFYLTGGIASAAFAVVCGAVAYRNLRRADLLR